ncbi:MAG: tRNA (5-methylaminomethyl-2-thiouridine)(34)-methyltransferase MnmD [Aureliella sp.]
MGAAEQLKGPVVPIPDRKRMPTGVEHLEWMESDDGSLTLWDCRLDESFHGGCGAVTESIVVYVLNGRVLDRLAVRQRARVFEVGLGTGTNFLLTAALAELFESPLNYSVVEPHLLEPSVISQLSLVERLRDERAREFSIASNVSAELFFTEEYLAALQRVTRRFEQLYRADWSEMARLQLGDHVQLTVLPVRLEQLVDSTVASDHRGQCDCVYFDAFSPKTSPELWTRSVFIAMRSFLAAGGCLVTYCVKGSVRREMQAAGFELAKLPGPHAGKREVLRGSSAD